MLPVQSVGIDLWNGVNSFIIRYALHLACGTKWNLLNWHGCGFIDGINKKTKKNNKCVENYKTYINKAEQQQNLINSNSRRDFTESQYYYFISLLFAHKIDDFIWINNNFLFSVDSLFSIWAVRGARPGKNVQLSEVDIRNLCLKSREIFLSQPILLELEAPLKICGELIRSFFLHFFIYWLVYRFSIIKY